MSPVTSQTSLPAPVATAALMARGSRVGAGLAVLALALSAVTVALDLANRGTGVPANAALDPGWIGCLTGLAQVVPGALLLRQLPRHPVAWLLVGSGLFWVVDSLCSSWTAYAVYTSPGTPGASATFYFYQRLGAGLLLGLPLILLVFPHGRLPQEPLWRRLSLASIGLTALLPVLLAVVPSTTAERFAGAPLDPALARLDVDPVSLALPWGVWRALLTVAYAGIFVSLLVPLAVVVRRYRAGDAVERAQLRWLVWAAVINVIVLVVGMNATDPVPGDPALPGGRGHLGRHRRRRHPPQPVCRRPPHLRDARLCGARGRRRGHRRAGVRTRGSPSGATRLGARGHRRGGCGLRAFARPPGPRGPTAAPGFP